jgi:hypothetical protein
MKMEQTQCSETSAIKHHTPGNNPKDYTQQIFRVLYSASIPPQNYTQRVLYFVIGQTYLVPNFVIFDRASRNKRVITPT